MPAAPTGPTAPPSTPAGVNIVKEPVIHAKLPEGEIHVTDDMVRSHGAEVKPSKKLDKLFDNLQSKQDTRKEAETEQSPSPDAPDTSGDGQSQETPDTELGESEDAPQPDAEQQPADKPAEPVKKEKANPWKLLDSERQARKNAEAKLVEAERRALPEAKVKDMEARLAKAEEDAKALAEELKYYDGKKHDPDYKKLEKEYESAFTRATRELSQVEIEDIASGQMRRFGPQDLLELVNTPLSKELTDSLSEKYGALAPYILERRNRVREIFEQQQERLEELKTTGSKRLAEREEMQKRQHAETLQHLSDTWKKANDAIANDEKFGGFFKPKEGDADWNQRLAKGFEIADRAFNENPMTPGLTPEERSNIVKRHAAVRNRAAAFGPLVSENNKLKARLAALEKELKGFKSSEPGSGQPKTEKTDTAKSGSGLDRLFGELERRSN